MTENPTQKVIRRLGGQACFARNLAKITGVEESRQKVWLWAKYDHFPPTKLAAIVQLCRDDGLPMDHPQLRIERVRPYRARRIA